MVTRLKTKDLPQPWQSSNRKSSGMQSMKATNSTASASEAYVRSMEGSSRKRGRPSTKSASKSVASQKGMKKTKNLPTSAVNVLIGVASTSIADVEELRRKRQEDSKALGRIVRTVSPNQRRRGSLTAVTGNSNAEGGENKSATVLVSGGHASRPQSSQTVPWTEENSRGEDSGKEVLEETEKTREPIPVQREGKEPVDYLVDDVSVHNERHQECRPSLRSHAVIDHDSDSRHKIGEQSDGRASVALNVNQRISEDCYGGKEIDLNKLANSKIQCHRQQMEDSVSMKSRRNIITGSVLRESADYQRSVRRSLLKINNRNLTSSDSDSEEFYKYSSKNRLREEYENSKILHSRRRGWQEQRESSSSGSSHEHTKRDSAKHRRTSRRQMMTSNSSMSPRRRPMDSKNGKTMDYIDAAAVKAGGTIQTLEASDRRRRRHEQALLDAEKCKRQRSGSKPFYLILDREGKPYGSGKPTWIAEINKLAIGLDPSCTNIRKQTFEDVQTFKNRLNDSFEYSGTLNEDYLRSLMGKAVTRRRSELISLIKSNGCQPRNIDEQVWRRLQKLATSKQREEKSEQGRYANACRKTLGRTGSRGIDGVREKLRSFLGRSPDPSEVEEEMQRDKGYGGKRNERHMCFIEDEIFFKEGREFQEEKAFLKSTANSHELLSDLRNVGADKRQLMVFDEKKGQGKSSGLQVEDELGEWSGSVQGSFNFAKPYKKSKEEYIKQLEAEVKLLRQGNVDASSFDVDSLCLTPKSQECRRRV